MRECIRCNEKMIENLKIGSNGTRIIDPYQKEVVGEIKCAVCPQCGYTEIYVEELAKIKKLVPNKNK